MKKRIALIAVVLLLLGVAGLMAYNATTQDPRSYGLTAGDWIKAYGGPRKLISLRFYGFEPAQSITNNPERPYFITSKDPIKGLTVVIVSILPGGILVSGTNVVGTNFTYWAKKDPITAERMGTKFNRLIKGPVTSFPEHQMDPAVTAIKRLGTNTLPFLSQALLHQEGWYDRWHQFVWSHSPLMIQSTVLRKPFPAVQLRRNAVDILRALGEDARPAIPALINALEDPDTTVRTKAVRILAGQGEHAHSGVPALTKALNDTNLTVRAEAFVALDCIGLDANETRVALGQWPDSDAVAPTILKLVQERNLKGNLAARALERMLASKDSQLRLIALCELELVGPHALGAVPQVIELLHDSRPSVFYQAVIVLARMGPDARDAIPALQCWQPSDFGQLAKLREYALEKIRGQEKLSE